MADATPQKPYRDERYEFNAPMWHAFPGPGEDGDGSHDSDSVSQYFNDPKATAALLTPNARQNVVTVRRRTGPNGRSSGLISPQPLKAAKRLRMEPGDENAPPAGTPASAAKKHKASNIRTSWGGAAGRRLHAGAAGSTRAQASGAKGSQSRRGSPAPWPPPPKRDALRHVGSPRSRGAAAAAAAAAKVAPATTAKASAAAAAARAPSTATVAARSTLPVQPGSGGRTRNQRIAAAAAAERAAVAMPANTSSAGAAAAAGEAAPTAGEAAAQQSAPRQPQPVAAETVQEPEVQQQKVQPAKTPRPRKRSAPEALPTPASEHRDFCHVTRSVAKALSPGASAAAAACSGPKTPPAAPIDAAACANAAAAAAAAAPGMSAPMMTGRKRSLRSHSSSPNGSRAADPAEPTAAAKQPTAATTAATPAAAAVAAPAAADADDMLHQPKRRTRPRKSGLHAGAAARIPSAAVDAASIDIGKLSASVIAIGAAAAVMSAKAAHGAAAAANSPLPAALKVPAAGVFRAAAAAAAADDPGAAAVPGAVRRDGNEVSQQPMSGAQAVAAPSAQPAQPHAERTAQHRASARLKALTVPHSPMLHSKLRYRPPNPDMTTEELRLQQSRAEAAEAARLRALNAASVSHVLRAMPRLPERKPRAVTVARTPPLRTARRPRSNDVTLRPQVEEPSVAEQLAAFEAGRGLPGGAAHTAASLRGSMGPPQLTHPQSPALRTTARLRPPRFVPTEDAEVAAMAAMPPFAARPLSRAMLDGDGGQGLPMVPRPLTTFEPFHLSETNAPAAAMEEPPFVFSARPVPPRPPKAPLTQPQPFALSTELRAPRRAAALAAEQAARKALTSSRANTRVSRGSAKPPRPPTQAASPKLSLTSRAAERARFDEELARKAEQAEAEQRMAAAARAEREAAELAAYRKTLQFKARPVPSAGDFAPGPGPAPRPPLTIPQSPYLNTRSRAALRSF